MRSHVGRRMPGLERGMSTGIPTELDGLPRRQDRCGHDARIRTTQGQLFPLGSGPRVLFLTRDTREDPGLFFVVMPGVAIRISRELHRVA